MKLFRKLKKDNAGASLIAVVIAMVFVVSIGVIIMNITLSNISMKEMELASKSNFYSAENVLETLKSSLTDKSAECMEEAYVYVLGKYASSIRSAHGVQNTFKASYLDSLVSNYELEVGGTVTQWLIEADPSTLTFESSGRATSTGGYFAIGHYNKDVLTEDLEEPIKTTIRGYLSTTDDEAIFEADYEAGTFTLKNVHITFPDSRGYETSLSTDIIIRTPRLNFDGTNTIEEFMKYSLIADNQIKLTQPSSVAGNAYAGVNGILNETGTSSFTGDIVVTRGTVDVNKNSTLNIGTSTGSDATSLWAENLRTSGDGSLATLNIIGNMYISDDLSLDSTNSIVKLSGSYFGYNFRKLYTSDYNTELDSGYERDADFSSSIIINGKNSKLDMTGLENLFLAGHAYISKGTDADNTDILTGESVSARTNQLEYNVPDTYIDFDSDNPGDAKFKSEDDMADGYDAALIFSKNMFLLPDSYLDNNKANPENAQIYDYVDKDHPFNTYYYKDNGVRASIPRFYLKFKDIEHANQFFYDRYNAIKDLTDKQNTISSNLKKFLDADDAIKIGPGTYWTLSGTLMTVEGGDPAVSYTTINSDDWVVDDANIGTYAQSADYNAQKYKSLQLDLTTNNLLVNSSTIRFDDSDDGFIVNDKSKDPLFKNLIDVVVLDAFLDDYTDRKYDNGAAGTADDPKVVVVDNPSSTYAPTFTHGILVATGDVYVDGGFTGMILSGGTIEVAGGTYSSDELMVSGLFEKDAALGIEATFTKLFPTYANLSSDVLGIVKVEDYIGYDNWNKYAD